MTADLIVVLALWFAIFRIGFVMLADAIRQIPYETLNTWGAWRTYLFGKNAFAVSFLRYANAGVLCLLIFLIPGVLIMRLRRPRPPWPVLIRQPGFLACALPAASLLVALLLELFRFGSEDTPAWLNRLMWIVPWLLFASVPLAWGVLAVRGQ